MSLSRRKQAWSCHVHVHSNMLAISCLCVAVVNGLWSPSAISCPDVRCFLVLDTVALDDAPCVNEGHSDSNASLDSMTEIHHAPAHLHGMHLLKSFKTSPSLNILTIDERVRACCCSVRNVGPTRCVCLADGPQTASHSSQPHARSFGPWVDAARSDLSQVYRGNRHMLHPRTSCVIDLHAHV